jgi:hypothetical protein
MVVLFYYLDCVGCMYNYGADAHARDIPFLRVPVSCFELSCRTWIDGSNKGCHCIRPVYSTSSDPGIDSEYLDTSVPCLEIGEFSLTRHSATTRPSIIPNSNSKLESNVSFDLMHPIGRSYCHPRGLPPPSSHTSKFKGVEYGLNCAYLQFGLLDG